jgi:hypothetical protein
MKHLSFLFVTFLMAAAPVQSAERAFDVCSYLLRPVPLGLIGGAFLCGTTTGVIYSDMRQKQLRKKAELARLYEPYAWVSLHKVTAPLKGELTWFDLREESKNDRKIAQTIAKNNYSDNDLWDAFYDAEKTVKERYGVQRYEVFSEVMAHILAPFTKRFSKDEDLEGCIKALIGPIVYTRGCADLQAYIDKIKNFKAFCDFFPEVDKEKNQDSYVPFFNKLRELGIWEKAQKISQQEVDELLKEGYDLQPHIEKLQDYDRIEHTTYGLKNDATVPQWVQISDLWHKHKREYLLANTRAEFNNLVIEAALSELLAPKVKQMLDEETIQMADAEIEVVDDKRERHTLAVDHEFHLKSDIWHKRHIRAGLKKMGFIDMQDEHINAIYDAYEKKKPNNVWQKALANASAGKLDASKSVKFAGIPQTHTPKLEKRNPEEVFDDRTKLSWYIYYPLYPFLSATVALKRRAPWSFTKAGILESNEEAAKQKSGINFDAKDKQSDAAPRDVLVVTFLRSYQEKLKKFNKDAQSGLIDHIDVGVETSLNKIMATQATDHDNTMQALHKDFRVCVNDFCVALDSFDKGAIKAKQDNVWHWFDDYLDHKDKSDYNDWKKRCTTITDRREYYLKALYNAHEDLAQAGKNLVDFWVQNSEKALNVSDVGARKRPEEMRDALKKYGVDERIVKRVFENKNEKS